MKKSNSKEFSQPTIWVHAPNVHQGGGLTLLRELLAALNINDRYSFVLDGRLPVKPKGEHVVSVKLVSPTLLGRLDAEFYIRKHLRSNDLLLCFGNLPPLFRSVGKSSVYLQNRHLIEQSSLSKFNFKARLRIRLERFWLRFFYRNVDKFIVQTQTMEYLTRKQFGPDVKITIFPFMANLPKLNSQRSLGNLKKNIFLFVSSGEPHKNHQRLIEAWTQLAIDGIFPKLCLTINPENFPNLVEWVASQKAQYNLDIENLGSIETDSLAKTYRTAQALIFPSKFESFGLPLLEAQSYGLPILAPELDYVRDVIEPAQTFDPKSALSIARAVKRFLGIESSVIPVRNAADFLEHLKKSFYEG
ncbi:glycosyltransferase [Lentilitoribacter sp. Alg239-R112]|uniref:glycosyltransferase n=1 Tax=Lentilitoribacter sp. Alg239-R112 TaxID=2305987 RepID=UPI0013A6CC40|nr:glycosyltransferase [Lentilitoribacter sp. Alg239-R112]